MPASPKQSSSPRLGKASWYAYHAGYSPRFVRDVISELQCSSLLDPWNGSGTSTQVASEVGVNVAGFDINPAMIVVAKARTIDASSQDSLQPLAKHMCESAAAVYLPDDPLLTWFGEDSSAHIRGLERTLRKALVSNAATSDVSLMSDVSCFFFTALFRTVTSVAVQFKGSNPTWVRKSHNRRYVLKPCAKKINERFLAVVAAMAKDLSFCWVRRPNIDIRVADSKKLPLANASVDAVLTSPPYCTRIDYAIATAIELAVLGLADAQLRSLRDQMIGTPTIAPCSGGDFEVGKTCSTFLKNVEAHPSKAAATYYLKTFRQYFSGMTKSFAEIARVTKPGGQVVVVVQDSFFKDLHVDVPTYLREIAELRGLSFERRHNYRASQSLVHLNTRSKQYRNAASVNIEAVLYFRVGGC